MDSYELREVFSRGMPTVTYVGREDLGLEKQLHRAVALGNAIVAVTGPSKCGKTVLRRKVVPDNVVVHVEGGQVGAEDDFWGVIRAHLEQPKAESIASSQQAGGSAKISGSLGAGMVRVGGEYSEGDGSSRSRTLNFDGPEKGALLRKLIQSRDVLVIDDFHYIGRDVRSRIVRALKSAVFDGLTVVMLSVPYRAFDVLSAEEEMEGRFTHVSIPAWGEHDLRKIAAQGFPALNVIVSSDVEATFAKESLGSPLLMQSLCSQLCSKYDIFKTQYEPITILPNVSEMTELFKAVASDFGLPAFRKLSAGPQTRTDRNRRKFWNGTTGDIYEAVMGAIAVCGAPEQISYDDLRAALRDILTEGSPQKNEVTSAIQQMCKIAKKMKAANSAARDNAAAEIADDQSEVPAVDWEEDRLMLNDVFLRFYLRWIHHSHVAPGDYHGNVAPGLNRHAP